MNISIIIINKDDEGISNTLDLLCSIVPKNVEIVVVDASSKKLEWIKKKFPRVIWHDFLPGKNRTTIPEQRNRGIEISTGEIIVFIDADCLPYKDWFKEIISPLNEENENIVAGKVVCSDKNSTHSIEFSKHEGQKYINEAPTMNIAFKRKVFEDIGLFDSEFQTGEDVDLEWRALEHGYRIRFSSNAIIYHDLGSLKKEVRRMYFYGKARIHLYRKHRERIKYLPHELQVLFFPLFILFLPLSLLYPIYLVLIIPFFVKNYKNDPLKLLAMRSMYAIGMISEIIIPGDYSVL